MTPRKVLGVHAGLGSARRGTSVALEFRARRTSSRSRATVAPGGESLIGALSVEDKINCLSRKYFQTSSKFAV
jgi:hypothetical protein